MPGVVVAQRPLSWPDSAWRAIGPASFGGRVDDIEAVTDDPRIIFVGTASGGVFRTLNNGTTWQPVFDGQAALSIGDIAIAPSNHDVVWVGTGEANNRQSSSFGDGIYSYGQKYLQADGLVAASTRAFSSRKPFDR